MRFVLHICYTTNPNNRIIILIVFENMNGVLFILISIKLNRTKHGDKIIKISF